MTVTSQVGCMFHQLLVEAVRNMLPITLQSHNFAVKIEEICGGVWLFVLDIAQSAYLCHSSIFVFQSVQRGRIFLIIPFML